MLQLDPKNRAARDQLVVVNQKTAQVAAKERQLYSRMFKMSKDDKPVTTSNAQTESKETKDEKKEEEEEAKVDSENQPATGTVEA